MNKFSVLIISTLLWAQQAAAGHENGNGGGGFYCNENNVAHVVMVDIWEGQNLWGLTIIEAQDHSRLSMSSIYLRALQKLNYTLGLTDLATEASQIVSWHEKVFSGAQGILNPPQDARIAEIPENCSFVGVFEYDDSSQVLYIDKENYKLLKNASHEAAGRLHEGIYWYLRRNFEGIEDSVLTRKIVACSLSLDDCSQLKILEELESLQPRHR